MILEKITIDELIQQFTSKDILKPGMLNPCLINGFVVATNGHVLIKVKQDFVSGSYKYVDGFPNVDKVLNSPLLEQPVFFNKELLRERFDKYRVIPVYDMKECKECEGDGWLECDLGHDHECEKCKGKGETKNGIIGQEFLFNRNEGDCSLANALFNPNYAYLLIKCADIISEETIRLVSGKEPTDFHLFEIGDNITIVIMPVMH